MWILEQLARYAETDRTAIIYGQERLRYAALDRQANAFAAYLRRTLPGDAPILLYGHKELALPVCMFGALRAGHGYIPVDTTYPPERVAQIAAQAHHHLLIAKQVRDGRTYTQVAPLDEEGRELELARIIGGEVSEAARVAAREMLSQM